jgi:hypothetical protein
VEQLSAEEDIIKVLVAFGEERNSRYARDLSRYFECILTTEYINVETNTTSSYREQTLLTPVFQNSSAL